MIAIQQKQVNRIGSDRILLIFLTTAQASLAVLEGLFFRVDRGIEALPLGGMKRVDVSGADLVKFRTAAAGRNPPFMDFIHWNEVVRL